MEDADALGILRELVTLALQQCEDIDLLDLIYKLLVSENSSGGAI